jgi:hypothetical protein
MHAPSPLERFFRHALTALPAAALALAVGAVGVVAATSPARAEDAPTFGVRIYEVFQRGPEIRLEERTSRAWAPKHVRNIAVGQVWPPEGQPGIKVYKSRDSLSFVGSYWREDGTPDYGTYRVEVTESGEAKEPGVTYLRVKIVPREMGMAPTRDAKHPGYDDKRGGPEKK